MPLTKSLILEVGAKNISTYNIKRRLAQAVTSDKRDNYYEKIGTKATEYNDEVKPEGWDEARPFDEIPGPKPLPLIGNLWRFMPGGNYYGIQQIDLHRRFRKEYGNLAYLSGILGRPPILFVYDPDDIEMIFRNEGPWPVRSLLPTITYYRKHTRKDVFQGVGGVITSQGKDWFQFRSTVNKILMQPRTAEMYVSSMDDVANGLIENIRSFSKNNPRNEMPDTFQNEIYKWTLESIGVIAFNKRIGCLDLNLDKDSEGQKIIDATMEMFDLMYKLEILPSLWRFISTNDWRKFVKTLDVLTEFSLKYIDECLRNSDPNPNIPDHERSVLERLAKIDKKVAFAMTTDMLSAGVDTTGRTMASALYFLAKNPEKQENLRKELKYYMPSKNSPVTKEMLHQLPYLKAVIKEITRISPVTVGTIRTSVKDMVLSGYQIPRGTHLQAVTVIPSLDEKHFLRANEFIPERWLRTTNDEYSHKNVHPFVTLPFGFGPRSCIGKRLANLELDVGISKVIRNFKLSWNDPDATFETKLLYGIMDPLRFKVEEVED